MDAHTALTKEQLAERLEELSKAISQQNMERFKKRDTPEYKEVQDEYDALQEMIAEYQQDLMKIKQRMDAIEDEVPDSTPEFNSVKEALIAIMRAEGLENIGHVKAKYSKGKFVNGTQLLHAIGGDMDMFMSIASVTQKAVNDFAKTVDDPSIAKQIKACIQEKEPELTDIVVELPDVA